MTTQAAAMGRATSNGAIHARSRIIGVAITLGAELGMGHSEVLALCDPRPVTIAVP